MSRIAVVGLGKLGMPLATVFASKGHKVIGIDLNESTVAKINNRTAPIEETGLRMLFSKHPFTATVSYVEAVQGSDTAFIIVPTPSSDDGAFSNEYVLQAIRGLGEALNGRKRYYNVVICSTVMPGSTTGIIRQELEKASGRRVGDTLGLCYSPEFIALGSVIHDLLHPDMVLIGESDKKAGDKLATLMRTVNDAPIRRMSITSAEIAKISVNAYVTMKISFANVLAEACENTSDANAHVIANAIGMDVRIGRKYLTPAVSFGGPCFPRDSRAFAAFAAEHGAPTALADATATINDRQYERIMDLVERFSDGTVAVLGLSYKPDTGVTEESFGTILTERLIEKGFDVRVYDPKVQPVASTSFVVDGRSVVVIATPWPEFEKIVPGCFERNPQQIVIDCWNIIPAGPWEDLNVYRVGIG